MKAFLGKLIGPLLFRDATVTSVEDVSATIRVVHLKNPRLSTTEFVPGDKIQVFLPEGAMRTYTPVGWDPVRGTFRLVAYLHGKPDGEPTPGVQWARKLATGDRVQFFGPRRSVRPSRLDAPVVLFGDETSVGVALALHASARQLTAVLEANTPSEIVPLLEQHGVTARVVARRGVEHLGEVLEQVQNAVVASPSAEVVLTGAAPSIQHVQKRLKVADLRASATKAYWALGKVGLD